MSAGLLSDEMFYELFDRKVFLAQWIDEEKKENQKCYTGIELLVHISQVWLFLFCTTFYTVLFVCLIVL